MTGPHGGDTSVQTDPAIPAVPLPAKTRKQRLLRAARYALLLIAIGFLAAYVIRDWSDIKVQLGRVSPLVVLASIVIVLASLGLSMLGWRALLADLGTTLPMRVAFRVLFLGQLSKYIPGGSIWSVIAQTELGSDYGVSRKQSAAAAMIHNLLGLGLGLLLAALALPALLADDAPTWLHRAVWVLPLGLIALVPPVLTRLINLIFRLLRREPLDRPFSWGGVLRAAGFMLLMWIVQAGHIYLLCVDLGADPRTVLVPAIGAYALAWSAGFIAVVLPAGTGTREALLAIGLAGHLRGGAAAALTIALVSRLVTIVCDLLAGLVALSLGRRTR